MAPDRCSRFRQDLSGFVDGTLDQKRWDQVGCHVAGCESCRAEAADLRAVCDVLQHRARNTVLAGATPATLSRRLQGIAGDSGDQPLYMPSGTAGTLPSAHQKRSRRVVQGGLATATVMCALMVVCMLLATEPARVADPVRQARIDYSAAVTAINVDEPLGAMLLAHARGADVGSPVPASARANILTHANPIPRHEAADHLQLGLDRDLAYSGLQRLWISDGNGQFYVGDLQVDHVPGTGIHLSVLDDQGDEFSSWFVPAAGERPLDVPESWEFSLYDGLDQVAGRWAQVLEATDADGTRVSRWWLDAGTSQLLWFERYDALGSPVVMGGFVELSHGGAQLPGDGVELMLMQRVAPAEDVEDRSWCRGLDHCPDSLAGLPLVGHASSDSGGFTSMKLIYSDGFRNVSVHFRHGVVDEEMVVVDAARGRPSVAVWQSDEGVISVATNGGAALLEQSRQELPAHEDYDPSLWERVHSGFSRMVGASS